MLAVPSPVGEGEDVALPVLEEGALPWDLPSEEIPFPALHPTRRTSRPRPSRVHRPPSRVLSDTSLLFRWLGERFSPGEATVWLGPKEAIEPLLENVYVGCALADGRVSLIEGANRFHPYRIGERGRGAGVDPGDLLDRIRLARAFTAYQLVALVDGWSKEARRHRPTLLIAHELPALFFTEEVPEKERRPLLEHVARTLRDVVRASAAPLLITVSGGWAQFPGLGTDGPPLFDLVRLRPSFGTLALEAYRDGRRLRLVPRRPGQHGLEEFGPDRAGEVTSWAAPYRRTARRSRSG